MMDVSVDEKSQSGLDSLVMELITRAFGLFWFVQRGVTGCLLTQLYEGIK